MKEKLGTTAGRVWETLYDHKEVSTAQLARLLRERVDQVYLALGWLAREDKIQFRTIANRTYVSLVEAERSL
jgi:hypothetical protein